MASSVTIYHNPKCGTSRKTLDLLREAGVEPTVVEYLNTPPSRETLESLAKRVPGGVRALLRQKEALCSDLGLADPSISEKRVLDAMVEHPILLNRPVVASRRGVRVCRPPETVHEVLGS